MLEIFSANDDLAQFGTMTRRVRVSSSRQAQDEDKLVMEGQFVEMNNNTHLKVGRQTEMLLKMKRILIETNGYVVCSSVTNKSE